jgi:large subunit ribosomal protein L21e
MAEKSRGSQHGARQKISSGPRDKKTVNEQLKNFEVGDKARIEINAQETEGRPHQRFHGKTVEVVGQRGEAYELEFVDGSISKTLFLKPVHIQRVNEDES